MLHWWIAMLATVVYVSMLTCTFALSQPKQFLVYLGVTTLRVVTLALGLAFLAIITLACVAPDLLVNFVQWQEIPTAMQWSWTQPAFLAAFFQK